MSDKKIIYVGDCERIQDLAGRFGLLPIDMLHIAMHVTGYKLTEDSVIDYETIEMIAKHLRREIKSDAFRPVEELSVDPPQASIIPPGDPRLDPCSLAFVVGANMPKEGWALDKGFVEEAKALLFWACNPKDLEYEVRRVPRHGELSGKSFPPTVDYPSDHRYQARCLDYPTPGLGIMRTQDEALTHAIFIVRDHVSRNAWDWIMMFSDYAAPKLDCIQELTTDAMFPERRTYTCSRSAATMNDEKSHDAIGLLAVNTEDRKAVHARLLQDTTLAGARRRLSQRAYWALIDWLDRIYKMLPSRPDTRASNDRIIPQTAAARGWVARAKAKGEDGWEA